MDRIITILLLVALFTMLGYMFEVTMTAKQEQESLLLKMRHLELQAADLKARVESVENVRLEIDVVDKTAACAIAQVLSEDNYGTR